MPAPSGKNKKQDEDLKELERRAEESAKKLKEAKDKYEDIGFDGAGTGGEGGLAGLLGLGRSRGTFIGAAMGQLGGGTMFEKITASVKTVEKELKKQTELNTGQLIEQQEMKKMQEEDIRRNRQNSKWGVLVLE